MKPGPRRFAASLVVLTCGLRGLCGCSSGGSGAPSDGPAAATSARAGGDPGRPAALVGREPLAAESLAPALLELAGAIALEEAALDRALEREIAQSGVTLPGDAARREEALLISGIADETGADAAAELLDRVRASRGLGPARYAALLLRNARLRALVGGTAEPDAAQLEQEHRLAFEARKRVRVIVTPGAAAAADARHAALAQPVGDARVARFAAIAVERSADASGAAGGLVPSMSPHDPGVPAAVRGAVASLSPGDVSGVIALEQGFAVVLLEGDAPALMPDTPANRTRVAERLRRRLERVRMDETARRLLATQGITPLDPSLAWAWDAARSGR